MPKAQIIKSEIQEIQKLKDIAEIMAAIAAGNLMLFKQSRSIVKSPYRIIKKEHERSVLELHAHLNVIDSISQILYPQSHPFISFQPVDLDRDYQGTMNILIGSDMGFCGKFNKGVKEVGKSKVDQLCLIGKQLTGFKITPISLPDLRVTGSPEEKAMSVIEKAQTYSSQLLFGENGLIDGTFDSIRIVFNMLDNQTVIMHQCIIHLDTLQRDIGNKDSNVEIPMYNHVFFDLYEKIDSDPKEFIILDPRISSIQEALYSVKKQVLIQLLTTSIIDNLIAENKTRSSSMESTKDEAQQIIYQLNKKMAKERQARITGELIELITSFTSLNQAV